MKHLYEYVMPPGVYTVRRLLEVWKLCEGDTVLIVKRLSTRGWAGVRSKHPDPMDWSVSFPQLKVHEQPLGVHRADAIGRLRAKDRRYLYMEAMSWEGHISDSTKEENYINRLGFDDFGSLPDYIDDRLVQLSLGYMKMVWPGPLRFNQEVASQYDLSLDLVILPATALCLLNGALAPYVSDFVTDTGSGWLLKPDAKMPESNVVALRRL